MGIKTTLTTETGMNTVIKGLPQSIRALRRFAVDGKASGKELIELISGTK